MRFYVPRTADGEYIKLPIHFWLFKCNWIWPLARDSPAWKVTFVNCLALFLLLSYVGTVFGEFLFLIEHQGEIANLTECLCTTFIGTQFFIRIMYLVISRRQMREIMERFFTQIYVTKSENAELHLSCEQSMRGLYVISMSFALPLFVIVLRVVTAVVNDPTSGNKPYFYRMLFPYDAQETWMYGFTSLFTGWVGFSSVSHMAAEDCFIGTTLSYCALRYKMLQSDLEQLYADSLHELQQRYRSGRLDMLHEIFRNKLMTIVKKQQLLDSFSKDLQAFLSPTIFLFVLFGMFLLCVLAFQLARGEISLGTFQYFFWLISQCSEFLIIGNCGQRYTDAAAELANSYYMSNWELLLPNGNVKENARLIKDVSFAIYRCQKSVHISGLKFVILSRSSIGSALSSSVSYFMFLNTMDGISSRNSAII